MTSRAQRHGTMLTSAVGSVDKFKVGDVPFKTAKARLEAYADLGRTLDAVRTFECDLFASSLVPIIIAHRHASISRVPGGKVLDIAGLAAFAAARPSGGT
ncbi:hypothetical protein [Sorangium sp. So ce1153]|uniref:hypothetical protein n=1 Tax=Sorangium sp. So ce1153 TaxID=3133333 RepID=UPI003F5FB20A